MTLRHILLTALLSVVATVSLAQAPIVQPGAPGLPSRQITAEEAIALAGTRYSAHDVQFMLDMIPHHQQALDMSALVAERTARSEMLELARRIEATQKDEIKYMENWLRERGERVPEAGDHEHGHAHHPHHGEHRDTMHGMATAEQMADLAAASGEAFDTLFLELMIRHHEGALTMVDELVEKSGSVQDPALFEFTTHIKNDQKAEIERMMAMATDFSPDPRAGLAAGFLDAGEAALHMELLAALPKPDGFVDPDNPAGLPSNRLRALARGDGDTEATDDESEGDETVAREDEREEQRDAESEEQADDTDKDRRPLLDFAHTDLAFSGNLLVAGNYHGFNIYGLSHDGMPELVSSVVCPGGQGDVSVVGNLLLLSVEQTRARLDCGLLGVADKISDERFRGLRIFDISDPSHPLQVGAVQTCRGSHTHTVVAGPGEDGKLIVYNSGTSSVRDEEELEGCSDKSPWRDEQTALFRIDVIEIPIDRPQDARVVDSPAVFADPETGILAGLWERGDHGPRTQTTSETNHCHDITVFPAKGIAAGACSGNGILFDISDPLHPKRIHEVVDPGFAYWHSATFSNDGTKVIFTDEWGGGVRPRCRASDPAHWGANAIYDIVDKRMIPRSHYKLPAPQSEQENCVAHNGSLIPVPGRDIMVQAWYQGGISVFDFTDSTNPFEIAFFDRGPIDAEVLVEGGYWSAYYYQGLVYGTEMARGLDVLALLPSEFLSEHEIAAARLAVVGDDFNPQQQFQVSWPHEPVVAHAYHDQLLREGSLEAVDSERLTGLLDRTDLVLRNGERDATLSADLMAAAEDLASRGRDAEGITRTRLLALSETLQGMASKMDAQS